MKDFDIKIQCNEFLAECFDSQDYKIELLKGDGSAKKIWRVYHRQKTFILCFHKEVLENIKFINLSLELKRLCLNVPEIYKVADSKFFYLQQDLGEKNFAEEIIEWQQKKQSKIIPAYCLVIKKLQQFHQKGQTALRKCGITDLIYNLFNNDLDFFKEYFLNHFDKEKKFTNTKLEFQQLQENLINYSLANKQGVVARDFQSRNIIFYQSEPYFIDYQDAVYGTILYDLASLLFASYSGLDWESRDYLINWSEKQLNLKNDFKEQFFLFVLIRRLRSLATYTKLGYLEGKVSFQNHFNSTLNDLIIIEKKYSPFGNYSNIMQLIYFFKNRL